MACRALFPLVLSLVVSLVVAAGSSARADVIALTTGGYTDTIFPSSTSSAMTVSLTNSNVTGTLPLAAWSVGLRVVPTGGATGTVSINTGSLAYPTPASNNILTSPFPLAAPQFFTSGTDVTVNASQSTFIGEAVPASGKSAFTVTFSSSPTANGTFNVFAFNDLAGTATNWTDDVGFSNNAFSNAPFVAGNVLLLGQINVVPVPEPTSLALMGLFAGGGAAWAGWRRRRRGPVAEPAVDCEPSTAA
jgi:hypothetical protein